MCANYLGAAKTVYVSDSFTEFRFRNKQSETLTALLAFFVVPRFFKYDCWYTNYNFHGFLFLCHHNNEYIREKLPPSDCLPNSHD